MALSAMAASAITTVSSDILVKFIYVGSILFLLVNKKMYQGRYVNANFRTGIEHILCLSKYKGKYFSFFLDFPQFLKIAVSKQGMIHSYFLLNLLNQIPKRFHQ